MKEIIKNKCYFLIKLLAIFIGLIIGIGLVIIHLDYTYGQLKDINIKNDISFSDCETYVFEENKELSTKMDIYMHGGVDHILEQKCHDQYPNKREIITEHEIISKSYVLSQYLTKTEIITLPENVVLEKSTIDIEIKIPSPNITYDVTFFGFSVGKIQNKSTIRIGATHDNILNKSYTLDQAYYDGDIEFILTNLKGNDIEVNYTVDFYREY